MALLPAGGARQHRTARGERGEEEAEETPRQRSAPAADECPHPGKGPALQERGDQRGSRSCHLLPLCPVSLLHASPVPSAPCRDGAPSAVPSLLGLRAPKIPAVPQARWLLPSPKAFRGPLEGYVPAAV